MQRMSTPIDRDQIAAQLVLGLTEPKPKPEDVAAAKAIVAQYGTPIMKALLEEIETLRSQLPAARSTEEIFQIHSGTIQPLDPEQRRVADERHRQVENRYGRD